MKSSIGWDDATFDAGSFEISTIRSSGNPILYNEVSSRINTALNEEEIVISDTAKQELIEHFVAAADVNRLKENASYQLARQAYYVIEILKDTKTIMGGKVNVHRLLKNPNLNFLQTSKSSMYRYVTVGEMLGELQMDSDEFIDTFYRETGVDPIVVVDPETGEIDDIATRQESALTARVGFVNMDKIAAKWKRGVINEADVRTLISYIIKHNYTNEQFNNVLSQYIDPDGDDEEESDDVLFRHGIGRASLCIPSSLLEPSRADDLGEYLDRIKFASTTGDLYDRVCDSEGRVKSPDSAGGKLATGKVTYLLDHELGLYITTR